MRTFSTYEKSKYEMAIFEPHIDLDKWNNEVSRIVMPSETWRMVHHSKKFRAHQNATIYAGKDKFLNFHSYYSDDDLQSHDVEITTAAGKFSAWWGDGEGGALEFPEYLKDTMIEKNYADALASWQHSDNEVSFILLVSQIISAVSLIHGEDFIFLNKEKWEAIKNSRIN